MRNYLSHENYNMLEVKTNITFDCLEKFNGLFEWLVFNVDEKTLIETQIDISSNPTSFTDTLIIPSLALPLGLKKDYL